MQSELAAFIADHTTEGVTPAGLFISEFLKRYGYILTHDYRLAARQLLAEQGLLLHDTPPTGDRNIFVVGPGGHAGLAIMPGTPEVIYGGKVTRALI